MSSPATTTAPLRILCLHGFFQSASIFRLKTAALRKVLKNTAELSYFQAPHVLTQADESKYTPSTGVPDDTYFCWWRYKPQQSVETRYTGWEESVTALRSHVEEHGPYDGYLGFSQGAGFLGFVAAAAAAQMYEQQAKQAGGATATAVAESAFAKKRRDEMGSIDCKWFLQSRASSSSSSTSPSPSTLPLLIFISGFQARVGHLKQFYPKPLTNGDSSSSASASNGFADPSLASTTAFNYDPDLPLIPFPSLHVIGTADKDIPPSESQTLAQSFLNSKVERHDGGHIIPSNAEWGRKYKEFMAQRSGSAGGGSGNEEAHARL